MNANKNSIARLLLTALVAITCIAAGRASAAILPPNSKPYGKTYSQWAKAWWQWAVSIPADVNPLLDATGQNAALGQSGPVWFLAGNLGGTSVRRVTVPTGKALLVPLVNTIYLGFPCDDRNLPGCESDQALEQANDIATLLSFVNPSMDGAALTCEIDGQSVGNLQAYREASAAIYEVDAVEGNIFEPSGLPAGPYHPCVDAGYYLLITPLSAGTHMIHFTGATAGGSFSLDVTYLLTITGRSADAL